MQNHPEKSNTPRFHDVISVYKSSRNTQYDKLFPMTLVPTCKRLGGHARPAPKLGVGCSHGRLGSRVPDEVFFCCCWREGLSVCSDCFRSAFRYEYNDMRRWGWWRTSCGEEKKRDWYDAAVTMKTPLYERADIFRRIHGHI